MNFSDAEQAYQNLLGQKQAGQLSDAEFNAAVQELRLQTPDGTWWQIREADGAWLRWDGSTWIQSQPRVGPPAKPKKKRSPILTCLMILGVFACVTVCLVAAVGGGGYYAFSNGLLSQREVLNAVGLGRGEISIVNISDDTLETELIRLDTESGSPETVNSENLAPYDISGYGGIQPGEYELHISTPSGIPAGGICRLTVGSGDSFQFVAVPSGIAVTQEGVEAQNADEIDMLTSGLCK